MRQKASVQSFVKIDHGRYRGHTHNITCLSLSLRKRISLALLAHSNNEKYIYIGQVEAIYFVVITLLDNMDLNVLIKVEVQKEKSSKVNHKLSDHFILSTADSNIMWN